MSGSDRELFLKMLEYGFRLAPRDHRRQCRHIRLLYRLQATEVFQ
jgi:hypothetical protein